MSFEKHAQMTPASLVDSGLELQKPTERGQPVRAEKKREPNPEDIHPVFSADSADVDKLRTSILRKYDVRLMPAAFLTYLIFCVDHSNPALARIMGLEQQLKLQGDQFNIALLLFFGCSAIFTIPGNLLVRKIGAGIFLPGLIIAWGVITLCSGFITDFTGLCVTRVLLGIAESSFLGAELLFLGFFYTHDEIIIRIGVFYSSTPLAASLGGFLAGGFGQIMYHGYNGWSWIFFLEGVLTIMLGVASILFMPSCPETARFLTPQERQFAVDRMKDQDSSFARLDLEQRLDGLTGALQYHGGCEKLGFATFRRSIANPVTVMLALAAFLSIEPIASFGAFLPTLLYTMGYQRVQATLMTVPPNLAAFFFVLGITFWSQREKITGIPLNICAACGAFGYMLLLIGARVGVGGYPLAALQYIGTFFVAMGVNAIPPLALAWISVNASPHYVRAITIGFIVGTGSLAAFISAFTYIKDDAPW
jgi:MFS family permease